MSFKFEVLQCVDKGNPNKLGPNPNFSLNQIKRGKILISRLQHKTLAITQHTHTHI
ncbi:hypothetical protein Scep_017100 [Stephania cephalantha]|uniref:Uncharacterized protein n=1 Tax=Stephania cephalantha TaxID=152367 RepID=A0AAP0IP11_9MAGN